jgi:hypothetical protein
MVSNTLLHFRASWGDSGLPIAKSIKGGERLPMSSNDTRPVGTARRTSGCEEHDSLLDAFGAAVQEVLKLHEQQFLAIVDGDNECNRFDLLIHMANEKKQAAKYAYIRHVESHGCSKHL